MPVTRAQTQTTNSLEVKHVTVTGFPEEIWLREINAKTQNVYIDMLPQYTEDTPVIPNERVITLRANAFLIASSMVDENHQLVFDPQNEEDINEIMEWKSHLVSGLVKEIGKINQIDEDPAETAKNEEQTHVGNGIMS